jgi:hypothetical protein
MRASAISLEDEKYGATLADEMSILDLQFDTVKEIQQKEISMAENKTKPTKDSATAFLAKIQNRQLREDCRSIATLMKTVSKFKPVMWGPSIVGFGTLHYVYESGREGDMPVIGFSPRKQNISIYLMCDLDNIKNELSRLGKHKTGGGCLYIKSLNDVNSAVLKQILVKAFRERVSKKGHPA